MLLYVMNEHPSVSETFVVTEAAAVTAAGVAVKGYALRRGDAGKPAAPLDLVCPPPHPWRLVATSARHPMACCRLVLRACRERIPIRETVRLLLAEAHAEYAWSRVEELGIAHVHAHFLGRTADVAAALSKRLKCQWTATAHASEAYTPSEPSLFRRRVAEVAGVACASRRVQNALLQHAPKVLTTVIHCGVDLSALEAKVDAGSTRVRSIVTIARLVPTKGHWTILAAAERALAGDENLHWRVIGGGELYDELQADSRYQALHPRLFLTGPLDHDGAVQELADASAFVLPCEPDAVGDRDGIPVALMEAMALGVPVITTDTGGIGELVEDHRTGFIVPPGDADSLARALLLLLYDMNPTEVAEITRAAQIKVHDEFRADREALKLIEFVANASGVRLLGSQGMHE